MSRRQAHPYPPGAVATHHLPLGRRADPSLPRSACKQPISVMPEVGSAAALATNWIEWIAGSTGHNLLYPAWGPNISTMGRPVHAMSAAPVCRKHASLFGCTTCTCARQPCQQRTTQHCGCASRAVHRVCRSSWSRNSVRCARRLCSLPTRKRSRHSRNRCGNAMPARGPCRVGQARAPA